jgi:hypothetical protein
VCVASISFVLCALIKVSEVEKCFLVFIFTAYGKDLEGKYYTSRT